MLSVVLRALLGVGLAYAANNACRQLGCEPDVQVVIGTTQFQDVVSTGPPYPIPTGLNGPIVIGAHQAGPGGLATVTYQATGRTTLVLPRQTPATPPRAGTSYWIATSTVTRNGAIFQTPYVTSTVSDPFACPTPATITIPPVTTTLFSTLTTTTTTTSVPNPIILTSTQTVTSTSFSILPPVTTTETATTTTSITSTKTETATSTTTRTDTSTTTETSTTTFVSVAVTTFTPPPVTQYVPTTITETSTSISTLPPITSTTTSTTTTTERSTTTLPAVTQTKTETSTTTETSISTSVSTSYSFVTSTSTTTFTSVSFSTQTITDTITSTATTTSVSTTTFCPPTPVPPPPPPPAPCQDRVHTSWTPVSVNRKLGTAGSTPVRITVVVPYDAYLQFTDAEWRLEKWTVTIDNNSVQTSDYDPEPNKKVWCPPLSDTQTPESCIKQGYSNGKWLLRAGRHDIAFEATTFDISSGYKYFVGVYQIFEKCD